MKEHEDLEKSRFEADRKNNLRVRKLECLAHAIKFHHDTGSTTASGIIDTAKIFYKFVR